MKFVSVEAGRGGALLLQPKETFRLSKTSGVRGVEVCRGTIWLTSTPATGDVVLSTGERFETNEGWPLVLEAMSEARIVLHA